MQPKVYSQYILPTPIYKKNKLFQKYNLCNRKQYRKYLQSQYNLYKGLFHLQQIYFCHDWRLCCANRKLLDQPTRIQLLRSKIPQVILGTIKTESKKCLQSRNCETPAYIGGGGVMGNGTFSSGLIIFTLFPSKLPRQEEPVE